MINRVTYIYIIDSLNIFTSYTATAQGSSENVETNGKPDQIPFYLLSGRKAKQNSINLFKII